MIRGRQLNIMNIKTSDMQVDQSSNDIAIIGLSCRFPGQVNSPKEFWDFLIAAGNGIVPVPADRWDNKAYYDSDRDKKNRMYVNKGGFLDKIDQFDPLFFGISPAEASRVDPQHRWLLELTYEAMENAGLRAKELKGSDTAVYIGQFMHDYEQILLDSRGHGLINSHSATGPSMTLTANRISYAFDFRGASATLDTACSSSLVALDLACKAVLAGDSHMAIAGGVNILLRPELTMAICKASMLSPDGYCKSFDAAANGYVRSEGAGIIIVKKLSDARRDGNNILAVIKATGVNQDGQTVGITVPSGEAQKRLLLKSLGQAAVPSETIQYVEAHGTGTAVGDPIEVNALGSVLGSRRNTVAQCVIGSVKSNIGHTEAAAGVAGLIKTVMAMQHGAIPKNLHYHTTSPAINLRELNLRVADELLPWPDTNGLPRRALVNSFGFGGTNANVVLEEAPKSELIRSGEERLTGDSIKWLPMSSKSEKGLKDLAVKYLDFFLHRQSDKQEVSGDLYDICYTAATKREHHNHRLVVNGSNETEMEEGLRAFIGGQPSSAYVSGLATSEGRKNVCFVFSGMGTQWAGMGRELYRTQAVFRAEMDRCSCALEPYTGWSLVDVIFDQTDPNRVDHTYIAQPGIFAVQVALAALLKSWGILPSCAVGHSAGEVGAAYIAGALDFEDAIKVIYHRSRLQQTTEGMGKMLAVGLNQEALLPYLTGVETKVSIGAINSEDAITLSGDEAVLIAIAASLEDKGIFNRFLNVGVPYHSPMMDQLAAPLIESLNDIEVRIPNLPLYSTVSGNITQPGDWGATYWPNNVRQPVLFKTAINTIIKDGVRVFVEVAPHAALASSIGKNLVQSKASGAVAVTLKRGQNDAVMLANTLGALHVAGVEIDWSRHFPNDGRFVVLPNYAWQHASYWCEADETQLSRLRNVSNRSGFSEAIHPLVGSKLNSIALIWQKEIDLQELSYLADHQVEAEVVYPAAGYIEMALGIARRVYDKQQITLEEIEFKRALFLDREKPTLMESMVGPDGSAFTVSAVDPQTGQWATYSQATLADMARSAPTHQIVLDDLIKTYPSTLDKTGFYHHCHKLGLSYLGRFQTVETAWFGHNKSMVEVALSASQVEEGKDYLLHPTLLDGAFQGLFPLLSQGFLPVKIGVLHYYKKPADRSYCSMVITYRTDSEITGDLMLFDADGTISVEVTGVELRSTKTQNSAGARIDPILYDFAWQRQAYEDPESATADNPEGKWIIFTDAQGVGTRLAEEMQKRGQSTFVVKASDFSTPSSSVDLMIDMGSSEAFLPLFRRFATQCTGIIYLTGLATAPGADLSAETMLENCRPTTAIPLYLAQALSQVDWRTPPQLYFVSQLAHRLDDADGLPEPSQGALWGFGRVFSSEFPEYKFSLIDLGGDLEGTVIARLAKQVLSGDNEQEIALRTSARYLNRLRALDASLLSEYPETMQSAAGDRPFKVVSKLKGGSENRLTSVSYRLPELSGGEVAIKVACAAVSWRCFETIAESKVDNNAPGSDENLVGYGCVGEITHLGDGVSGLSPGDQVVAFITQSLASHVHSTAKLSVRKPHGISSEEAVMLPIAYLPAHYAVNYLAALKDGENVLIHEAADMVGLAAVQFARLKQANIFATAGTPEKRAKLYAMGIARVYDSTTEDFVDLISAETSGGVDVVLNVLTGRLATKTLGVIKRFGRFIELGQTPAMSNSALIEKLIAKNVSYHSVELTALVSQRPGLCGQMMTEIANLFEVGLLSPIEGRSFSIAQLNEAFSSLQYAGKNEVAVLAFDHPNILVSQGIDPTIVSRRSTYLVTGGLGGLGLEIMDWLVGAGAQSIALVGRSAPSEAAQGRIEAARAQGVVVIPLKADVANSDDVSRVLQVIAEEMLPLAGIIHAAGVLDDGVITQQNAEKFARVLTPKIKGAWNLHRLTSNLELDFFVCFSSIASIVGWAGQSNYAAANGFIDTLAHHRRALGKPALTINWGPWSGSGMAANLDARDLQRMEEAGMSALKPEDALTAMSQLLIHRVPQAGVFDLDWSLIFKRDADPSRKSLFRDLMGESGSSTGVSFIEQFSTAAPELREGILGEKISSLLAEVLGVESGSQIDRDKNVVDYGVNSLMGMDFRNRLQGVLKTKLPATLVLKYPTVNAMVKCIIEEVMVEDSAIQSDALYWDPKSPEVVQNHEINGPLATLTPSVLNWIHEGHTTHFNIGALLEIDPEKFNLQALKTALRIVFTYHDGCRVQLYSEGGSLKQEIVPLEEGVHVEEYDLRGPGYAAGARKMEELNDGLQRSFEFKRGSPLYRAACYRLDGASPYRFFLIFHHYISDAMSQKILWQSVKEVYIKVLNREPVHYPIKTISLIDWTRRLYQFAHREAIEELPYWLEKIENSRRSFISDDFKSNRERQVDDYVIHHAVLERTDYARLVESCRTNKDEVSDAVTYALVRAFEKLTGSESLWVDLITHARSGIFPEFEMPGLFGQISESGSVLFELETDGTDSEQIRAIRRRRLDMPHAGIGLRALRFINQSAQVREKLQKDELPQIGLNIDTTDYSHETEEHWGRFASESLGVNQGFHLRKNGDELRLAFFVDMKVRNGQLMLAIGYYKDRFYQESIAAVANRFISVIKGMVGSELIAPSGSPNGVFNEISNQDKALLEEVSQGS